ncbi:MAG: TadE/TadG family type IV pilus assembly protein [Alphaproteobacteria bacterium]
MSHYKRMLRRAWFRFQWTQQGIAAVEFAAVLPFLVVLFLGTVELSRYTIAAQKTEKAAMTISDLVAQAEDITTGDMDVLVLAVQEVMQPFAFDGNGYVIISSVSRVGSGAATVNWQYTGGGTWTQSSQIGGEGLTATLPTGFALDPNEGIIIAEVYFNYTPMMLDAVMPNTNTLYKIGVFKPRLGELTSIGS